MKHTKHLYGVALTIALGPLIAPLSQAADHIDSPTSTAEPSSDITDLFAWIDGTAEHMNLVMNVTPFAGETSTFSNAVTYAFHINSASEFGAPATETLILCQFPLPNRIECWVNDQYVWGDPVDPQGITSADGSVRVFAGLRDDPFFMEFTGFTETVAQVQAAAPNLSFDAAMCPLLDDATRNALVGQLQSGMNGAPASDTFQDSNVLSLVIQLETSLVTPGGPIVGVWASTHQIEGAE